MERDRSWDASLARSYETLLEDIREQKAELQTRLEELDLVESFHCSRIAELKRVSVERDKDGSVREKDTDGTVTVTHANGDQFIASRVLKPSDIQGLNRHEALAKTLAVLNRPARVPEIVDLLLGAGHGTDLKKANLQNACYTAMSRKQDVFTRLDDAQWGLREWDDREDEQTQ